MGKLIFLDQRRQKKQREEAAKRIQQKLPTEEKLLRDGQIFHQDTPEIERLIQLAKNTADQIKNKQLGKGYCDGLDDD